MRKLAQLFIVVVLSYTVIFAQLERQEEPTYKQEGLDYLLKPTIIDTTQLDSIINQRMSVYHIPGLTALVTKKEGGMVWKRNYGLANIPQNKPVADTTLFLLASVSKTILATAVMQFWEADSFDLDDPVNEYLDNFQVFNPHFPNDTITIKMLLAHTSGINDRFPWLHNFNYCGDSPIPLETFLINYLTPGGSYYDPNLNFSYVAPGAEYNYSNIAAGLLAILVEKFSGMSFNQYCRENIFDPLGMDKSSFLLAELDTNDIATPYLWSGGQYIPFCHMGHPLYPVAFLRSNKIELQHFLVTYMNLGKYNGNIILDSSTVALMLSDHLGYPVPGYGDIQGLVWYQSGEMNGRFPWGHTGTWWGANAGMFFKQEEDWGIICFWNAGLAHYIVMDILNILCDFAQYYGNIYALNSSVDKAYAQLNVDSVLFRTQFSNIYNHPFTPHLIFANLDSTLIDSLTLFDDGLHGDSLLNDGIYGGYIPIQQNENFYTLSVSTVDNQTGKYFYTPDMCRFTSVGPVVLNHISWTKSATNYYVTPFIENQSTITTITNASVKLICNDPWVTLITSPIALPDIPPGSIVCPSNPFAVSVNNSIFPGYFNFKVEVMSDGWPYWTDTIRVETVFQLTVSVVNGWNMVSIPGLHPANQNVLTWWPGKDPMAEVFKYGGMGYNTVTTATPGEGYWMKHLGANVYNTGDEWPSSGIQFVLHNPLAGIAGWNLIGGYEQSVSTSGLTTNPPDLITGPVFKYSGGYQVATTLDPGYGYWIKLSASGQIIIPEGLAKGEVEYFAEDWGRIILTDAAGRSYTLYAANNEVNLNLYELPPAPPAGMFDIRFNSGRIAEDLSNTQAIEMNGVENPLKVKVENMDIRLQDETGKILNVNMKNGENVVIDNSTITKLMVSGELIPSVYSLSQNYPNPFNPTTKIQYSIREKQIVTLIIYDILGSKVATLVKEEKTAGKYEVEFDPSILPSGVYFYQLNAGSFVETKKMILLK